MSLFEKKVAAEDDLLRIEIRANIDGTVHQLSVHTIGGVIGAGETVMMLVPMPTFSAPARARDMGSKNHGRTLPPLRTA